MATTNVLVEEHPTHPARRILPGERCDRCCAPACVYVVVGSGLDLVLCSHHARQHEQALRRSGALMCVDRQRSSMYW